MHETEPHQELSASLAAAHAVRRALLLRDAWTAELESAWSEWASAFPHVDEPTAKRLRAAFEVGYRAARAQPLMIMVPPTERDVSAP